MVPIGVSTQRLLRYVCQAKPESAAPKSDNLFLEANENPLSITVRVDSETQKGGGHARGDRSLRSVGRASVMDAEGHWFKFVTADHVYVCLQKFAGRPQSPFPGSTSKHRPQITCPECRWIATGQSLPGSACDRWNPLQELLLMQVQLPSGEQSRPPYSPCLRLKLTACIID